MNKIRQYWDRLPIVYKLFAALIGGIMLIILMLLGYMWGYESKLMLKKEQEILHNQSLIVAKELDTHMDNLQKEIRFFSHLEIMDDMVAHDLDRRISQLLEQKAHDLGESIDLFVVASDTKIYASSRSTRINQNFALISMFTPALKRGENYFFSGEKLFLFTPLYGSFYTQEFLGYLVLAYPIKNFELQLNTHEDIMRWLSPPEWLKSNYTNTIPSFDAENYLHDEIAMQGVLSGWTLHYAMPKTKALSFLYHFQLLLLGIFGVGALSISFLVWIIVSRLINPLRELSLTARTIAQTGDYTQKVPEYADDEIGEMAKSFNALMDSTRISMERIELLGKTQAALQTKSSFLSSMSHELRTPLGSILSLTQYLMTDPETPEKVSMTLEKIENSSQHLLGVINNVLDLAKAEAGKMKPRIALCHPVELVNDAIDLVRPLAEEKGLMISVEFDIIEKPFQSDSRLLSQVVINLLSNAIKYTRSGSIRISLDNHEDVYLLQIKDSGRGIDPEALEHLFDEFYQVESEHHDSLRGSGLGLAISKRIALLLRGDLLIGSEGKGHGTVAYFYFRSFSDVSCNPRREP